MFGKRAVAFVLRELGQQVAYAAARSVIDTVPPIITIGVGKGLMTTGHLLHRAGDAVHTGGAYVAKYGYDQRRRVQESFTLKPYGHLDAHTDERFKARKTMPRYQRPKPSLRSA